MAHGDSKETRDAISALRRAIEELIAFVEGLTPDELTAQSGASEWTVAAVLSHLGSSAELSLIGVTTGKNDMAAAPAVWDRWNAMPPAEQAARFAESVRALSDALEAFDDDQLAEHRIDLGYLPLPVDIAFFTRMRIGEVGLHGWDVRVASQPDATVPTFVVPFVLSQLPLFLGYFAKPGGTKATVEIELSDPDGTYALELGEESSLTEGHAGSPGTTVRMPAEAFARLTSGRLAAGHTPASVEVKGELTLDDLRRIFPGY